jgi:hypothetical protein
MAQRGDIMMIRLCTEDINSERVRELCAKQFDCFTMFRGMGCWKGQLEPSLTIEIAVLSDLPFDIDHAKHDAEKLARAIKLENQQEAVLIEYLESTNILI